MKVDISFRLLTSISITHLIINIVFVRFFTGELDEIKNDISSLRFELLEEFKKDPNNASTPQLAPKVRKTEELSIVREAESNESVTNASSVSNNSEDFIHEMNGKVRSMETKIDSLSHQMDTFKKDILEALKEHTNAQSTTYKTSPRVSINGGAQNHDVEYI